MDSLPIWCFPPYHRTHHLEELYLRLRDFLDLISQISLKLMMLQTLYILTSTCTIATRTDWDSAIRQGDSLNFKCIGSYIFNLARYLAFQSLDYECTWWKLFQKRVVCTKFDIYVYIKVAIVNWLNGMRWLYHRWFVCATAISFRPFYFLYDIYITLYILVSIT